MAVMKPMTPAEVIEQQVKVRGNTIDAELWYPPRDSEDDPEYGRPKYINVDLIDVRASDGFRTYYDFDRDGWVIQQASTFEWDADDTECDPDWQEVAFVQSWAREVKDPPSP